MSYEVVSKSKPKELRRKEWVGEGPVRVDKGPWPMVGHDSKVQISGRIYSGCEDIGLKVKKGGDDKGSLEVESQRF